MDTSKFLLMGDTHIGYQNRSSSKKVSWHQDAMCIQRFCEGIEIGLAENIDGVIHAGDIFDEEVTQSELRVVEAQLQFLSEASIPFFYITGNHENEEGLDLLKRYEEEVTTHLTTSRNLIGVPSTAVFGIDYKTNTSFQTNNFRFSRPVPGTTNVLILHQTLEPYREKGEADLRRLLNKIESKSGLFFDFVASGHLHDSERYTLNSTEILYTGSPARISRKTQWNEPSVWLLEVARNNVSVEKRVMG